MTSRKPTLRHPHVQRMVEKQLLKHGERAMKAFQQLCRRTFAYETDAQQALATFEDLQATCLHEGAVRSTLTYRKRGRPHQGAQPAQVIYTIEGALASSIFMNIQRQCGMSGRQQESSPPRRSAY